MSEKIDAERASNIAALKNDGKLQEESIAWVVNSAKHRYSYNFTWLGRPIVQLPQDIVAMQEIVWQVKPDLVIETGIAHGGSIVFYASMLELLGGDGHVVGIDVEIRPHNRQALEQHPLRRRYTLVEGSSIADATLTAVKKIAKNRKCILVCLDSNHAHDHVLQELRLYAPMVTKGSYLVVFDTLIEHLPAGSFPDRPWDKGSNPLTAVKAFLKETDRFEVDTDMDAKLLLSVARGGYLKCVR